MKTILFVTAIVLLETVTSCGSNSEKTVLEEKAKMDSVARITEELTRLKVADEQRIADSIAAENEANLQNKAKYKIALADAKTALLLAKEKLSSIKEFQLGRLDWEKEKQIEDQYKVIQSCEMEVDRIQSKLLKYD